MLKHWIKIMVFFILSAAIVFTSCSQPANFKQSSLAAEQNSLPIKYVSNAITDFSGLKWLDCRLYMSPRQGIVTYASLLKEVINTVITSFQPDIRYFHFFRYGGLYQEYSNEPVQSPLNLAPEDYVDFVKLRVLITENRLEAIRNTINELAEQCSACTGVEIPVEEYDIVKDFGERFGESRVWQAADLIQCASILALDYAVNGGQYDPQDEFQGGTRGLVHLVANTLYYQIDVQIADWERLQRFRLGP